MGMEQIPLFCNNNGGVDPRVFLRVWCSNVTIHLFSGQRGSSDRKDGGYYFMFETSSNRFSNRWIIHCSIHLWFIVVRSNEFTSTMVRTYGIKPNEKKIIK